VPLTEETQPEVSTETTVRYVYVARTRLKIGNRYREPGERVPEAASWPNLAVYLDSGQLDQVPIVGADEQSHAVHREDRINTLAPENYDELKPTPPPVVGQRYPAPGCIEVVCGNCRGHSPEDSINYVPEDKASFQCWQCGQQQRVVDALTYPPQSYADVLRAGVRPGGRQ
jgi:hypothetical protein